MERKSFQKLLPQASIRVVLADPHAVTLWGMRAILEQSQDLVVVGEARNGTQALHLAKNLTPDVLMLELELPDLTGTEIAYRLAAIGSPVRVLILSAYLNDASIHKVFGSEVAGCILKESQPQDIIEAIRVVAQSEDGWFAPKIVRRFCRWEGRKKAWENHGITSRELEVLKLLSEGLGNEEIADLLSNAVGTIKNHLTSIYMKLGVRSRAEAIVWAHTHDLHRYTRIQALSQADGTRGGMQKVMAR